MESKIIGAFTIIVAVALLGVVFSYTEKIIALELELHKDCDLPAAICPAQQIPPESAIGYVIVAVFLALGVYNILLSRKSSERVKSEIKHSEKKIKSLSDDQRKIHDILAESGAMFQSDLVDKSGMDKVKVTRLLDKMEGLGLIERKRRGMSNMVVLKN